MKYLIWGAGVRGSRYVRYIPEKDFIAFVDNDLQKVGTIYCGKPVISFAEYMSKYTGCFLIVGMLEELEPVKDLERKGIWNYLLFSECPGEYQEMDYHTHLQRYIQSLIKKNISYLIYGSSFFAIQLNELLYKCTGKYASIMLNKNLHQERGGAFAKTVGQKMKVLEYGENFQVDCVLTTCEDSLDELRSMVGDTCKILHLFDCSKEIEAYHNPQIEAYKNLHDGESCFIVATGPSLKMDDLNLINRNKIITISMNSIWKAFDSTKWRPTYYMTQDPKCYVKDKAVLQMEKTGIRRMFLADTNDDYWRKEKPRTDFLVYHLHCNNSEFHHPKFSDDLSRRAYDAATITYICIQMAVYMGFKRIFLLGVDFSSAKDSGSKMYGHFCKEKDTPSIGYTNIVRLGYESARRYADEHGVCIYNATRGGYLEIFDRVDFDSLFRDGFFMPEQGVVHHRPSWYE